MFHTPHRKPADDLFKMVQFERYALQTAIEVARAEGFEGTEAALKEMLSALEESLDYPDF